MANMHRLFTLSALFAGFWGDWQVRNMQTNGPASYAYGDALHTHGQVALVVPASNERTSAALPYSLLITCASPAALSTLDLPRVTQNCAALRQANEVYEKIFDPRTHGYYYYNTYTFETTWTVRKICQGRVRYSAAASTYECKAPHMLPSRCGELLWPFGKRVNADMLCRRKRLGSKAHDIRIVYDP